MIYAKDIFPVMIEYPSTGERVVVDTPELLDQQKPGWIIVMSNVAKQESGVTNG